MRRTQTHSPEGEEEGPKLNPTVSIHCQRTPPSITTTTDPGIKEASVCRRLNAATTRGGGGGGVTEAGVANEREREAGVMAR